MIKRENHADKKKGLRSQTRNLCVLPAFACFDTSCNRCCRGEERDNATTRQGNKTNKRYKTTIQTNATACMFRVCIMFATPFSVCFETRHGSKLFDVSSGLVATICRHILGVLRVFRPRCTIHLYPHPCTHAALHLQRARSVVSIARCRLCLSFTLHHTCSVPPAACR